MAESHIKVLIACEFSGVVREEFTKLGHNAWSCDLLDTEIPGNHYQGDVLEYLDQGWDLMIAHPPCTYLARSGARWWKGKEHLQAEAIEFVRVLLEAPIPRIVIENPIGRLSTALRKPDQIIQPWMFGHGETKATCLWLKNLPPLQPTEIVEGRSNRIHNVPETKDRWKIRSRTYPGIAKALAEQYGSETF